MKKLIFINTAVLALILFSCTSDENYEFGDIIVPSEINFSAEIIGADAANPYGAGTGEVVLNATAKNALAFKYIINGVEHISPSGRLEHLFTTSGLQEYTINIVAIGTAGIQSSL